MIKWTIYAYRYDGRDEVKTFTDLLQAQDYLYTISADPDLFDLYVDGIDRAGRVVYDCSETLA